MTERIRIAQSVMDKAGALGLDNHDPHLAELLKRLVRSSAVASGNFNDQRRRYGSYILTVRDNTLVDINCTDDDPCMTCLGIGMVGADWIDCEDCYEIED